MAGLVQTATTTPSSTPAPFPTIGPNMINANGYNGPGFTPDAAKAAIATSKDYYAQQATATPASSQGYTSTDWNVDKPQTVAGNLEGLTDPNSPLNQQAAANALQASNKRGLVNSSLAVTAGQDAILKNALPVAQQDASTQATAAQTNAGAKNTASQFTANAANQASLNNSQLGTNVSINNANLGTKAASDNASGSNNASIANLNANTNLATANLSADTQKFLGQLTSNTNLATSKMSADTQLALGNLDAATKTTLQNIVSKNSQLLQVNTSAANVVSQGLSSIAAIQTSDKMDAAAKTQAINNILATMQQGIDFSSNVAGLDLPKYFTPIAADVTPPATQNPASQYQ